ncbi:hypothetical protein K466DRAFT_602413 [Polyporus arcularius HHB13444]|uniref:DUF1793-domain-containing protein n=1 Tax=Polyporus arcularius HHB13444 TaxID=1314778 RepID=A0A5C3P2T6_9APHY|nr:hypothetical protein K466DRAFT_602413 [Polyporus arcularius HHB13444]
MVSPGSICLYLAFLVYITAIDTDVNTRAQFSEFENLTNIEQTTFGPMVQPWYVFSFAVNLGNIQYTSSPMTWAVGYVRDPVVRYTTPSNGVEVRRPYWTTRYSDIGPLIDAFVADYTAAYARAVAFDEKLMADAAKISPQYVDLVSLVARQVMGAIDIAVLGQSGNTMDAMDVKAFMKDIGFSQRVNPVERMFAAFPAYLYLNASLGGALLAPLLEAQDITSGLPYAAQDIGISYPNATGTHGPHPQGIERHTDTFWDTANGESNSNMTNLAIKGIIGVKAMAEISRALQQNSDSQYYDSHVGALASSWLSMAQSNDKQHAWTLLTSATVTDDGEFAPAVVEEARGKLHLALPQLKGLTLSFSAALGAMFAHLALSILNTTIVVPDLPLTNPTSSESRIGGSGSSGDAGSGSNDRSHVGAIVGGVLGGVTLVAAAGAGTFFYLKQGEPMVFVVPYPHHAARYDNQTTESNARGSSKAARERAQSIMMQRGQPTTQSELFATDPAALATQGSAADSWFPNAFPVGLRTKIEHLRTPMQGIREEKLQPPPEYSS